MAFGLTPAASHSASKTSSSQSYRSLSVALNLSMYLDIFYVIIENGMLQDPLILKTQDGSVQYFLDMYQHQRDRELVYQQMFTTICKDHKFTHKSFDQGTVFFVMKGLSC